ncbi:MAG: hypothetical protein H0U42_00730 [Thermoleophilaceae bacterium]|nr:hypothetical protein [Thermoleophilaceae bacterium]
MNDNKQPESAEGEQAAELSEEMPEEVSGEGATPLGSSDQYSSAPGPHGLGPITDDPDSDDESPGLAPLEEEDE